MTALTLPQSLDDALVAMMQKLLPAKFTAAGALERAILDLSARYTTERAGLVSSQFVASDDETLSARGLFFLPADLLKVHVPLAELERAGTLPTCTKIADFGAGLGTQTIGALSFLGARAAKAEILLADRDTRAISFAGQLVRAAARTTLPQHAIRVELLAPHCLEKDPLPPGRFDLILMGTALNELFLLNREASDRTIALRTDLIARIVSDHLSPGGRLILIEPALRETARALEQVRDRLLVERLAQVQFPCLRRGNCPALLQPDDYCHEDRAWQPTARFRALADKVGRRQQGLKFSYLVLARPNELASAAISAESGWSRVVSEPLISKGKCEWHLCNEQGRERLRILDRRVKKGEIARELATFARGDEVCVVDGVPISVRRGAPQVLFR